MDRFEVPSSLFLGYRELRERLEQISRHPSLPSTYLFWGPEGTGKRQVALEWSKSLLCANPGHPPDLACVSCRLFLPPSTADHPDLLLLPARVDDDEDKEGNILIDQTRKFIADLTNAPLYSPRRVGIVNNAHKLTDAASNSLLKTLEDPPDNTVLILVTHLPDALLPTVRSRALSIAFPPLPRLEMERILDRLSPGLPTLEREAVLHLSRGAPGRLQTLISSRSTCQLLQQIISLLVDSRNGPPFDPDNIAQLSDEDGFTLFLDTVEALLLSLYRQDASVQGDSILEQGSRQSGLAIRLPHLKRTHFHDRVQQLRTLQVHNINRGLAVEEFLWDWKEAIGSHT
ncbi:MAG: hypothetical protein ACYCYP_05370 [Leptospirales bacterium]